MSFIQPLPPGDDQSIDDEPGVMHIGGPRGRRVWEITRWVLVIAIIAALMVALFMRFGATALWAGGLVGFMLGYMAIMARWAGGDHER
jgi:hypothetical protein